MASIIFVAALRDYFIWPDLRHPFRDGPVVEFLCIS